MPPDQTQQALPLNYIVQRALDHLCSLKDSITLILESDGAKVYPTEKLTHALRSLKDGSHHLGEYLDIVKGQLCYALRAVQATRKVFGLPELLERDHMPNLWFWPPVRPKSERSLDIHLISIHFTCQDYADKKRSETTSALVSRLSKRFVYRL